MSRREDRRGAGGFVAMAAVLLLLLTACGGSGQDDDGGQDGTSNASGGPTSIVSLSPTTTEMLFAVGAGESVVAVDDQSDYPEQAPRTALSGYTPNLEAILSYEPELVVLTDDNNDIVAGLERVGVEVLQLPAAKNLDETYAQIEKVGEATGRQAKAAELTASMRTEIEEIVRSLPTREVPLTYYHELDDTYYSVGDDTYLGQIYRLLGLRSIAPGDVDYPKLSAEYIIEQNPELIFLADSQCCGVTPEKVAARAGWSDLRAVVNDQVHVLDEDIASRWGPRVVDLMRTIAGLVSGADGQPTP